MTNIEKGRNPEGPKRKVQPVLGPEALRNLRIALSAGLQLDVNRSGGPVSLDWDRIESVAKRDIKPSLPKPYGE